MSCRVYSVGNDLIAGACVVGNRGLGVLGSQVPSTGTNGPSILFSGLSLPAEASNEFRALILTVPGGGSVFFFEDGSVAATGFSAGTYQGTYQAFKDGVSYGTANYTFQVGAKQGAAAESLVSAEAASASVIRQAGVTTTLVAADTPGAARSTQAAVVNVVAALDASDWSSSSALSASALESLAVTDSTQAARIAVAQAIDAGATQDQLSVIRQRFASAAEIIAIVDLAGSGSALVTAAVAEAIAAVDVPVGGQIYLVSGADTIDVTDATNSIARALVAASGHAFKLVSSPASSAFVLVINS